MKHDIQIPTDDLERVIDKVTPSTDNLVEVIDKVTKSAVTIIVTFTVAQIVKHHMTQ